MPVALAYFLEGRSYYFIQLKPGESYAVGAATLLRFLLSSKAFLPAEAKLAFLPFSRSHPFLVPVLDCSSTDVAP